MPDSTWQEDIERRMSVNDPVEVRNVPGTEITLRVFGFYPGGHPVIHLEDLERFDAWLDSQYKCTWCCDTKAVYTNGQEREPDPTRRGPPSPCPKCVRTFTEGSWWKECDLLPTSADVGVDVQGYIRQALSAYLTETFYPDCTKAKFAKVLQAVGWMVAFKSHHGKVIRLTLEHMPYTNGTAGEGEGRLGFKDDQGRRVRA